MVIWLLFVPSPRGSPTSLGENHERIELAGAAVCELSRLPATLPAWLGVGPGAVSAAPPHPHPHHPPSLTMSHWKPPAPLTGYLIDSVGVPTAHSVTPGVTLQAPSERLREAWRHSCSPSCQAAAPGEQPQLSPQAAAPTEGLSLLLLPSEATVLLIGQE